ncbi:MAG: trypsin-like peptidase domain-containing protein, partial [Leadbetterella sp.]|nr:trypsin-like peptidase domain-containing protein [Leadbetterella sp.]
MNKLNNIAKGEEKLVREIKEIIASGNNLPLAKQRGIDAKEIEAVINDFSLADRMPHVEAVVVPYMRPVLFIRNGRIEIPESNELKERIIKYKPVIEQPLNSVGRIELKNHQLKNIGTGWLIAEDIIVTNRHVAELFALNNDTNLNSGIFRKNFIGETIEVAVDFKEEFHNNTSIKNEFEIELEKILYLPDASKNLPDIALLKIKKTNSIPEPIPFINGKINVDQLIGVVGYPLQDPR